jgi:hypothetical protein
MIATSYGEIFERNGNIESKLGIPCDLNYPPTKGGITYAPPIR